MFYIIVFNPKHILVGQIDKLISNIEQLTGKRVFTIPHMNDNEEPIWIINPDTSELTIKDLAQRVQNLIGDK